VAAALDYTVVEGRREGDVRATTAENIRKLSGLSAQLADVFRRGGSHVAFTSPFDHRVVQGREGDVRATTAENIRKLRRKAGEPSSAAEEVGVDAPGHPWGPVRQ
jgi:hypothetical protein